MDNYRINSKKISTSIGVVVIPMIQKECLTFEEYLRRNWGWSKYNIDQLKKHHYANKNVDGISFRFDIDNMRKRHKDYVCDCMRGYYINMFMRVLHDKKLSISEIVRLSDEHANNICSSIIKI